MTRKGGPGVYTPGPLAAWPIQPLPESDAVTKAPPPERHKIDAPEAIYAYTAPDEGPRPPSDRLAHPTEVWSSPTSRPRFRDRAALPGRHMEGPLRQTRRPLVAVVVAFGTVPHHLDGDNRITPPQPRTPTSRRERLHTDTLGPRWHDGAHYRVSDQSRFPGRRLVGQHLRDRHPRIGQPLKIVSGRSECGLHPLGFLPQARSESRPHRHTTRKKRPHVEPLRVPRATTCHS